MLFLGILLCVASTLAIPLSPPVTRTADNVPSTVDGISQNSVVLSKNAVLLSARNFSENDAIVSINHDTREDGVENSTIQLPVGSAERLVTRGSENSKVSENPKKTKETKKVVSVTFTSTEESRTPWGHNYRSYAVERVKEMVNMQFIGKEVELELDEESHPGYPTCTFNVKVSEGSRKKTGERLTGEFTVKLNRVDIKKSRVTGGFKTSDGSQTGYPYIYPPPKTKPLTPERKSRRKKKTGTVLKTVDNADRRIDTIQEEEE